MDTTTSNLQELDDQLCEAIDELENATSEDETNKILDKVRAIVAAGADVNDGDSIFIAVCNRTGNLELVKIFVEAGADVNVTDPDDYATPLYDAKRLGYTEIAEYLKSRTNDELKKITYLQLEAEKQRQLDNFIKAALKGNLKKIKEKINNEIDVNVIGSKGSTALHVACCRGRKSVVRYLLSAGANPNIKEENKGRTPLMEIIDSFYNVDAQTKLKITQMLIEAGADINAIDNNDDSALKIAKSRKLTKIIELLLETGAKEYPNS